MLYYFNRSELIKNYKQLIADFNKKEYIITFLVINLIIGFICIFPSFSVKFEIIKKRFWCLKRRLAACSINVWQNWVLRRCQTVYMVHIWAISELIKLPVLLFYFLFLMQIKKYLLMYCILIDLFIIYLLELSYSDH